MDFSGSEISLIIEAVGFRDYEAKWGQNSGLKVCARGWMSKITIWIVRNF